MRRLDRSSAQPLWAQLLDDLRSRLDAGEFTDAFPTDLELTQEYRVSRHTAREAVRHLQAEGVVTRERGRGTFVRTLALEQPTGALYSLFRSIEAQGLEQRSDVLDRSLVVDPEVAGRLELPEDADLVRIERLRLADGQPLAHDVVWMPGDLAGALLHADLGRTALYDELQRHCGVRPVAGTERITTELPRPAERQLLRLPARQPVFRIHRRSVDADGRCIEWRETSVRGDRFAFVATWSPDGAYEAELQAAERA